MNTMDKNNDSKPLSKAYDPKQYEDGIYEMWEDSGVFNPDQLVGAKGKYSNILPPPNANGELHIGHASGHVVMDLLGRFHRMLGKKVLLLPGKDHAGIQTQVVYERKIKKERGITRHDLGREKFYQEVYNFCIDRSQYMRNQEKKLGLSADWSREKFTLDPTVIGTAVETFVKMFHEVDEDGKRMAYRGERIINWCPRCESALADVEVEHEEQQSVLYTFKYSKNFPFEIATTRPETKLGDTAVAVHPDDKRYQNFIGKTFEIDFVGVPLKLKVIADHSIEMDFGTGALGVTPAHSFIDWQIAEKNGLPILKVINEKGLIVDGFGEFSKKPPLEARKMIVAKLKKLGLLQKEEDLTNNIAVCERCKSTIEPLPSQQWFIDVDHKNFSLKKAARKAVENEQIRIHPARFKKVMLGWIDNVHDWCVSRQIWWGPRIPAWYRESSKLKAQSSKSDNSEVMMQLTESKQEIYVGMEPPAGDGWKQDDDTFDTWFSSGQWAYTTLDYPTGNDFKMFYPSDNMIMGRDILPFWAFRMIILSLYRTKSIPFKNLYFTGLIRDENGQKMSKSKGNGIEPLEMIEKYGTDAVRMSLLVGSSAGNDTNLGEAKIAGFRNLVNKLWNISRFILQKYPAPTQQLDEGNFSLADRWIMGKMDRLVGTVTADIEHYRFSQAGESLRDFTWNDLADWYLEVSKFELGDNKASLINGILRDLLKLWHPFIPFVTETIWQQMENEKMLIVESWPRVKKEPLPKEQWIFEQVKNIITAIRNARSEYHIEPAKKINVTIQAGELEEQIRSQEHLIKNLRTGIGTLKIKKSGRKIPMTIPLSIGKIELFIGLEGALDLEKELVRLQKELHESEKFKKTIESKLENEKFLASAPPEIVAKEKEKLELQKEKIIKIKNFIKTIEH